MAIDPEETRKEIERIKALHEAAANVAREKINRIHKKEPNAKEEIKEVKETSNTGGALSKHQQYMDKLTKSGLSLSEIQTAWHKYYESLSNQGKHEVWNEFYSEHQKRRQKARTEAEHRAERTATPVQVEEKLEEEVKPSEFFHTESHQITPTKKKPKARKTSKNKAKLNAIKSDILENVSNRAKKSKKKSHLHSLGFGLSVGTLVMFILLFSFFNERFITPFIRPSQNVSATSIIVDPTQNDKVGPEPKLIIPKINTEVPVVYDEPSIQEDAVQEALKRGVIHYAITPNPGELGNAAIFGHSSSNILNSGNYKFAFMLLRSLDKGDTFYANYKGKRYVYKVYNKYVTSPNDLSVLDPPKDRKAIMTLVTCDPPGFSTNRLIVQAEQIYPNPNKNKASSVDPNQSQSSVPEELPGNSESLWARILKWLR